MTVADILLELREQPANKSEHWEACHAAADIIEAIHVMVDPQSDRASEP